MATPDVYPSYSHSSSYEEHSRFYNSSYEENSRLSSSSYEEHSHESNDVNPVVYNNATEWYKEMTRNPKSKAKFESLLRDKMLYQENKIPEKSRRTSNLNSEQISQLFPGSQSSAGLVSESTSSASLANSTTSSALLISDVERKVLFNNSNNQKK